MVNSRFQGRSVGIAELMGPRLSAVSYQLSA